MITTPTAHSKLSPSAAHRWSVCTASVGYIEESRISGVLPAEDSSRYAEEGRVAHDIAANLLLGRFQEWPDKGMIAPVGGFVEFVRGLMRPGDQLLVERKFSLFYKPEDYGTSDATIVGPGRIVVSDFKYGVGVSVTAFENEQLAIYAESLIRELEEVDPVPGDTGVWLYIYQPRDRNDPEPVREWKLSRAALAMFCMDIDAAAQGILRGAETKFVVDPDNQCRFCPAKGICKAYAGAGISGFTDLTVDEAVAGQAMTVLTDPKSLTREQRVRVIAARKGLESWLEAVEDQEMAELLSGADPMGFKLVEGMSNRKWSNAEAVKKLLRNYLSTDEICPPSEPVSPAQVEKLLKGKTTSTRFDNKLASLIVKPEGRPSLVPESDPRPALKLGGSAGFQDLTLPTSS